MNNSDIKTVEGFGYEWNQFNQIILKNYELQKLFDRYFKIFPWESLSPNATGFDLGCGSGRWAKIVAEKVGLLHCIDASGTALQVAKHNLSQKNNCQFHLASVDNIPLTDNSMDFGYSLGVLHHIPNPLDGIKSCVKKLKPGAPFLIYIYYAFDNRPFWFRFLWQLSNLGRLIISKLPNKLRYCVTQFIAATIYYPWARLAIFLESRGVDVELLPLSYYRHLSFYTMRTDALDRFGTRLEHRFTANQIKKMMAEAGLERIVFSDSTPYWCAVGYKSISTQSNQT